MQLSERAMLVNLNIAVWHAEREDSKRAADISAKYGSDPKMGKYRRYLIDPDVLKPILKKRGEMRNRHYELTLPWGDDAARIITSAGFMRYRDEMNDFQNQLSPMFEDFVYNYPAHVANAASLLNGLYNPKEYPSENQIKGYFRVGIKFKPVPDAGDFRVNLGSEEIDVIRQQIEADTKRAVNDAMADVAERVQSIVRHMGESLRAYDNSNGKVQHPFRDSLVGNVRDLADCLPGLNVAGLPGIDALVSDIKSGLCTHDADTLRVSDVTRENVAKKAEDILSRMAEYGL